MKRRPGESVTLRKPHRYEWLWEPLAGEATFVLRSMFGAKAAYLDGKIVLCFCAGDEPWRGVLACTDRERQPLLRAEFPELSPHAILPKWLYLPEAADRFETVATALVRLAKKRDPRLGVIPKPRKRRAIPVRKRHR
ncbi:MAG: hypothetical protein ABUL61_06650 [Oleiharenicola lentus]